MTTKTTVAWTEGMAFEAELDGHTFALDASSDFGGRDRGPRPKGLLLVALAGCTGMDVVSLLNKMRVAWQDFRLEVSGDLSDQHPKVYDAIRLDYIFSGDALDREKIEKAVALSQEKYCGVYTMLSKAAVIHTQILLNP
jgi:putative redox protein